MTENPGIQASPPASPLASPLVTAKIFETVREKPCKTCRFSISLGAGDEKIFRKPSCLLMFCSQNTKMLAKLVVSRYFLGPRML